MLDYLKFKSGSSLYVIEAEQRPITPEQKLQNTQNFNNEKVPYFVNPVTMAKQAYSDVQNNLVAPVANAYNRVAAIPSNINTSFQNAKTSVWNNALTPLGFQRADPTAVNNLNSAMQNSSSVMTGLAGHWTNLKDQLKTLQPGTPAYNTVAQQIGALERNNQLVANNHNAFQTGLQNYKSNVSNTNVNHALKLAGGTALAVGGAVVASKIISNVLYKMTNEYQWKKKGCDGIENTNKRLMCQNFVKQQTLKQLTSQQQKCKNDPQCLAKVRESIDKVLNTQ